MLRSLCGNREAMAGVFVKVKNSVSFLENLAVAALFLLLLFALSKLWIVLRMLAQLGYSAEINEIYELSRLFAAPCRPGNCRTSHNLLNVTSLKYFVINWLTGGVYVWCWSKRVPVCSQGKCGNGSGFGSALFSAVKHWRSAICHWFVVSDVGAKRCQ